MDLPIIVYKEMYVTSQIVWTLIIFCFSFVAESTFSSRICSSEHLIHFLIVCPVIMLLLLLTSLLCLYWKARKLSQLSLRAQKEKALCVDMKRATGDWTTVRKEDGGY